MFKFPKSSDPWEDLLISVAACAVIAAMLQAVAWIRNKLRLKSGSVKGRNPARVPFSDLIAPQ